MPHPGVSTEQKAAETFLINAAGQKLGLQLQRKRFVWEPPAAVEVDGYSERPLVLCEAWAHVGQTLSAQRHKVLADALKLLYLNNRLGGRGRLILVFGDAEAVIPFQNRSWAADCLSKNKIEVLVIPFLPKLRSVIKQAQKRQYR